MARLSRIAHRIVWANPRTQSPRYRPEVGGMAAAWPYCDAVVSAHSLDALGTSSPPSAPANPRISVRRAGLPSEGGARKAARAGQQKAAGAQSGCAPAAGL